MKNFVIYSLQLQHEGFEIALIIISDITTERDAIDYHCYMDY